MAIVTASDRDTGSNALLSYSLSTGAGQFRVNSETGMPHNNMKPIMYTVNYKNCFLR